MSHTFTRRRSEASLYTASFCLHGSHQDEGQVMLGSVCKEASRLLLQRLLFYLQGNRQERRFHSPDAARCQGEHNHSPGHWAWIFPFFHWHCFWAWVTLGWVIPSSHCLPFLIFNPLRRLASCIYYYCYYDIAILKFSKHWDFMTFWSTSATTWKIKRNLLKCLCWLSSKSTPGVPSE